MSEKSEELLSLGVICRICLSAFTGHRGLEPKWESFMIFTAFLLFMVLVHFIRICTPGGAKNMIKGVY